MEAVNAFVVGRRVLDSKIFRFHACEGVELVGFPRRGVSLHEELNQGCNRRDASTNYSSASFSTAPYQESGDVPSRVGRGASIKDEDKTNQTASTRE